MTKKRRQRRNQPQPKTEYYAFKGGLDLETPALSVGKGSLIGCLNYEAVVEGGYRRIDGFERHDGRTSPADTRYHTVDFEDGSTAPDIYNLLHGANSGATGLIIDYVVDSGSWVGGDAAGYFVIIVKGGIFEVGEPLNVVVSEAFTSGFDFGFR